MNFVEIENTGKQLLERFPLIKHSCKRIYHLTSYALSDEKFKNEGNVIPITPNDSYEYFYGYYDKSPWDIDDQYMLALRVKQTYKSVAPKEPGHLILIDTKNNNLIKEIGIVHAWNVQQGCMAQWLGPDFKSRIIYNDFRNGNYCSIIYNIEQMKEEKILPLPIYDVSKDGSFALSLDFSRLHRLRPGYGYSNLPDATKQELCPDKTCIWKIDIQTCSISKILKYTDLAKFETSNSMHRAEHKVNHLMISPNGKRFMFLHRWFQKGHKYTRLVTANTDGSELYNLSDDVFVSHCFWKNNKEILSFLRKKESGNHYYLLKDQTKEYRMFWSELNTDGHCSYSFDGKYVITDTYPDRKRFASVYLCTEKDNKSRKIARVFAPFRYDFNCRCDLHPRWNHSSNMVCIDSVHNGKRGIYVIPIPTENKITSAPTTIPKIIHTIWLGNGKKSKIVQKSMDSWTTFLPDYKIMEWNENNFDIKNSCKYVQEAYKAKKWAFVSDYIRLKVLYEFGGIYFDTDLEVLRNLDEFLSLDSFLSSESHHTICTALLAAKPHTPWVKDLLDEYETLSFINEDGTYNQLPNTKRVQKYLEKKYNYCWLESPQELEPGFIIYPSEYFSPLNCYTGILKMTNNTYTIHHYDNTWKSNKEKIKKKVMQLGTRIIGEDNRAKLVEKKHG